MPQHDMPLAEGGATLRLVPVFDHAVVNVRDGLDQAAALWERMGFALTPRGHHTLGSSNHLAVFGTDYLELLGVQPGNSRGDVLDWPAGLNGLAFKTFDADSVYDLLHAAGLPALPVQAFSRPVQASDGLRDAAFRTVRLQVQASPAGRLFFCEHLTPALVWNDAGRRHVNGALGIMRAVIVATDPAVPASLLTRLFDWDAAPSREVRTMMPAGLARLDILTPDALLEEFGDAAPAAGGRAQWMAALTLRTASLGRTAAALTAGGVAHSRRPHEIVVPASTLDGMVLVFQE